MPSLAAFVVWIDLAVCAALAVLGVYRSMLLCAWWRQRRAPPRPVPPPPAEWPVVTVQIPIYNERFVARRILAAAAALDYPRARLQIQVLDDSTDRTATLVRRACRVLRRRGLDVEWLHRRQRDGYKAGALAHGLRTARGELIAIFDADFVPPPDFLRRVVPHVLVPGIGVVQARWGHLNRDAGWFTRLQAVLLDGHFAIEQPTRDARRWLLTFNGTAGVWRRTAIDSAGGWSCETLTEDLDLSLRAQLAGWRIRFVGDVVVPAELPADSNAFRAQQRRWTQGGVQVARKLLPHVWRAPLPWSVKFEATMHMIGYAAYPLLVLLLLLRTPVRLLTPGQDWYGILPGELPLFALGTVPIVLLYLHAQRTAGAPGGARRQICDAVAAVALGGGLAVSNAMAVVAGLCGRRTAFERTPKRGALSASAGGRARRAWRGAAYRSPGTRAALLELGLLGYLVLSKLTPHDGVPFAEIPFLALFAFGLIALSLPSLHEAWLHGRRARATIAGLPS
jgi:GT2 family glycosyltransferase